MDGVLKNVKSKIKTCDVLTAEANVNCVQFRILR